MLSPNTILQNRYRIVRKLGQGGMGAIYEAIDERVSSVVALKETLVGSSRQARTAFQREAALLANLRHAALPKVMDYFGEADSEFLVMEFIPGTDFGELLRLRDGPFSQEDVLRWGIELLKVLEYLHTHNPPILHRDIKPANIKKTDKGEVYLLDFGLAKGVAGQMPTLQTEGSIHGYTPFYAPLEQILGEGTDARSDLYSLAATLYHLLTGQAPVSAPARFDAIENDQPDPLRKANQLNVGVASELAICIHKVLSISRKDRPSSATEMRIAFEYIERVLENRETARRAEDTIRDTVPSDRERDPARPPVTDDDVQFTVFTPQKIKPDKPYSVLAFAHLSKRRADASEDEPDPIEEMKNQAARVLGDQSRDYRDTREASGQPVPRGGDLSFVPSVKGLTFEPPRRSFTWRKSVHREEFDVRASREVDGQTLQGTMTVFLGSLIIAEVVLWISVDSFAESAAEKIQLDQSQSARRVRQIFASYSKKDEQVVEELANVAPLFGSRFILDRTHLEPGEDRILGMQRLIRNADVFQLFWSTNSMRSSDTVNEIKYAAALGRAGFILPTYWEEPIPRSPGEGLPPPEIERLQFHRIYPGAISRATYRSAPAEPITAKTSPVSSDEPLSAELARVMPTQAASYSHSQADLVICPVCNARSPADFAFCSRCGSQLELPPTQSTQDSATPVPPTSAPTWRSIPHGSIQWLGAPSTPSKKSWIFAGRMPIYAGAAAMVLFVMVLVPLWFMSNGTMSVSNNAANRPADYPTITNTNAAANANTNVDLNSDIQITRVGGGTVSLTNFRGRVVLLNFWSTRNSQSRDQIPALNELQRDFGQRGLHVIGVSLDDTSDEVREFQQANSLEYELGLHERKENSNWPVSTLPTTYVIDRRGRIRSKFVGAQSRSTLETAIESLINEQP